MLGGMMLILLVVVAAQQQAPVTIVQKTSGWCSPAIANVVGNVTVNCIGVDPRALKRLNERLSAMKLDRDKAVQAADEWTSRYKELGTQLSQAGDDTALSHQAEEYLHEGELEKAGAILDQVLGSEEKQIDRTAANHYNRALVFELQFQPLDSLPHLAKAYGYRPEQVKYGLGYSRVLLEQNDFSGAEPVLLATLARVRVLAKENPTAYQADVATTLNSLAVLYHDTQRMKETGAAFQEALDIRRQLAKANPAAYLPDVATTLNNLALLYRDTQRLKEAEVVFQEALDIYSDLAKANPTAYQPDVATTLNNLAFFHRQYWTKVVTNPLGLAGFALFLVFSVLARVKRHDERRWLSPLVVTAALLALLGGLTIAYVQVPKPAQTSKAPSQPQPNQAQHSTSGAGSPAVQGVQGDVTITIDQSSGQDKSQKPAAKKLEQDK
jgi:tetratricopeptide (TPR) repeat protein